MILAAALSALVACGGGSGGSGAVIVPETPADSDAVVEAPPPPIVPETPADSDAVVEAPPPPIVPETPADSDAVVEVLPPPPPVEDRNAAILGGLLAYDTELYEGRSPLRGYTISGGTVRDDNSDTSDDPVQDTTASIINVPDWRGSKWVRTLGDKHGDSVPGGIRDEFVIFTDKEDASDMDYMDLAYWIQYKPADSVPFEDFPLIKTISVGSKLLPPGAGAHANGSATYLGPAMGLYAKKERGVYQEYGEFRAQAALSANFNATPPADAVNWKPPIAVSGTISGFRDAQGNVIDNSWKVTLQEHLYDGSTLKSYWYRTGATAGGNSYTFNFFGPATKDGNNDTNPEYIGGSFRESFGNGAVSGAFAAKREP